MSSLQIPSLSRNVVDYFNYYLSPPSSQEQISALEFFESYANVSDTEDIQRSTINPLEDLSSNCITQETCVVDDSPLYVVDESPLYVVDESPLPEIDGVLQLKLPMLCSDNTNMYSTPPLMTSTRDLNRNTSLTSVYDLALSHITFAVDSIPILRLISRIQNVTLHTPEIYEVVQNNNTPSDSLYTEHLICICFDCYGNHRFAKFAVNVKEVSMHSGPLDKWSTFDAFAVEVIHLQGDSRISMGYFKQMRYCISIGDEITDSDYAVDMPDFGEGFSDMYEDDMVSNPNTFK